MQQKISGFFNKKTKQNFDFDVNSTAEFGKIQPVLCTEVVPDGTYNFKCHSMVQVAPLLSPLFGRISLRSYTHFVPMQDIFHHYHEVMGKRKVTHGKSSSLVSSVPTIKYLDLLRILFNMRCVITPYETDKMLVPLSYYDNIDDYQSLRDYISDQFGEFLFSDYYNLEPDNISLIVPNSDEDDVISPSLDDYGPVLLLNSAYLDSTEAVYSFIGVDFADQVELNKIVTNRNNIVVRRYGNMPTVDNADFVIGKFGPIDGDPYYKKPVLCIRMSSLARDFRKVLIGLGMQIDTDAFHTNHPLHNKTFSILPFLAYYKAWFDIMYPKRSINFANTNAGKIITYLDSTSFSGEITSDATLTSLFTAFCQDLANMQYVYKNDFFTAHLSSLGNDTEDVAIYSGSDPDEYVDGYDSRLNPTLQAPNGVTSAGLKLVSAVNNAVLSGTFIGKRVNDYLRQHGINTNEEESSLLGSNILDVDTGTIMSSVENDNMFLGQKGGHAEGRTDPKRGNKVDSFDFTAKKFGFIIRFICVVPQGGYSQGISPVFDHKTRYSFYNQQYDGIGYRLTPYYEFFSSNSVSLFTENDPSVFLTTTGFISRYAEYKYKTNLANGDFTRRSTRKAIGSYYLDRRLPENEVQLMEIPVTDSEGSRNVPDVVFTSGRHYMPDEGMRFCNNELFDFNRVFASRDEVDDNYFLHRFFDPVDDHFIIHQFNDYKGFLPVLPLEDSMGATDQENEMQTTGKVVEMS